MVASEVTTAISQARVENSRLEEEPRRAARGP